MNTVVSGALDRLHYEKDPCVKYDIGRKLWIYLHRSRSQEEFGKQPRALLPCTLWRSLDPKVSCLAAAEDSIRLQQHAVEWRKMTICVFLPHRENPPGSSCCYQSTKSPSTETQTCIQACESAVFILLPAISSSDSFFFISFQESSLYLCCKPLNQNGCFHY